MKLIFTIIDWIDYKCCRISLNEFSFESKMLLFWETYSIKPDLKWYLLKGFPVCIVSWPKPSKKGNTGNHILLKSWYSCTDFQGSKVLLLRKKSNRFMMRKIKLRTPCLAMNLIIILFRLTGKFIILMIRSKVLLLGKSNWFVRKFTSYGRTVIDSGPSCGYHVLWWG